MGRLKKAFYVVAPVLAFSYLAYEVSSEDIATGTSRRGKAGHDLLAWLSHTLGPAPTALMLVALGLLLSVYAYRRY